MLGKLSVIGKSPWYWLAIFVIGFAMEGMALYYQYALDYGPCVLCIHVRIWTAGFMAIALLAMWLRRYWATGVLMHLLNTVMMFGILERAWQLLGTERGTIFGSCQMTAGLPDWFALDSWFPGLFGVWEACGYTPEILFGITMAEFLLLFGVLMSLISVVLFLAAIVDYWRS